MIDISQERYQALMKGACDESEVELSPQEFADGWHFCEEWDGLLIHPSHPEADCCHCIPQAILDQYRVERNAYQPHCRVHQSFDPECQDCGDALDERRNL